MRRLTSQYDRAVILCLPDGRCPAQVNDNTVKIGKRDLMLCPKCDDERRRRSSVQADNASGTNGAQGRRDNADNAVSVPGPCSLELMLIMQMMLMILPV